MSMSEGEKNKSVTTKSTPQQNGTLSSNNAKDYSTDSSEKHSGSGMSVCCMDFPS